MKEAIIPTLHCGKCSVSAASAMLDITNEDIFAAVFFNLKIAFEICLSRVAQPSKVQ